MNSETRLISSKASRKVNMDCKHFLTCNANLCPLDPDIASRSWFIGEDVCKHKDHKDLPMIRRQKQLNRLKPAKYAEKPIHAGWLRKTAPRKISLSPEEKAERLARLHRKSSNDTHPPAQGDS